MVHEHFCIRIIRYQQNPFHFIVEEQSGCYDSRSLQVHSIVQCELGGLAPNPVLCYDTWASHFGCVINMKNGERNMLCWIQLPWKHLPETQTIQGLSSLKVNLSFHVTKAELVRAYSECTISSNKTVSRWLHWWKFLLLEHHTARNKIVN